MRKTPRAFVPVLAVPLTKGLAAIIDADDAYLVEGRCWYAHSCGYAADGAGNFMHRVILGVGPKDPGVDHINGNGLDNRRANLRLASKALNSANQRLRPDNTSGYRGVSWSTAYRCWRAYLRVNRKGRNLGSFTDPVEAARAYDTEARRVWGEFARVNFPAGDELGVR